MRREQSRRNLEKGRSSKRQSVRFGARTDTRSRAVQAFWAMHLEALNWSGMSLRQYASALNLSRHALQKWRTRHEDGELEIDWRSQLHPSARPRVRDSASTNVAETALTARVERRAARRFFSDEQKLAIARESDQPGTSVSATARKHGIVTGLLFRWRVEFGIGQNARARLATVLVPEGRPLPMDLMKPPAGMMAMTLEDGARVFVPEGSDPGAVLLEMSGRETLS
ncbi:MAG: transposase [Rhodobacterales bacterium 32-64-14]|nr:MAG: transposase [Rhodobacterales bacterium 32-64-14]